MATRPTTRTLPGEHPEHYLIRASQLGDAQAAEILFQRYNRLMLHTALRITRNAEDAEEAVQDGLLSAYRNLKHFEGRAQFRTWLTRIVINAALMTRRRGRLGRAVSLGDDLYQNKRCAVERFVDHGPDPEEICAAMEMNSMLQESLDELSPLLRSAFVLCEIRGLSTGEAAEELKVSQNAFKTRLWRARHQLAKRIESRVRGLNAEIAGDIGSDERRRRVLRAPHSRSGNGDPDPWSIGAQPTSAIATILLTPHEGGPT